MINPDLQSSILQDFEQQGQLYQELARNSAELIKTMLQTQDLHVHSVTWRCKQRDSLARKIANPDKSYQQLHDITDLAAVRIITYFDDEVDAIAQLIAREFAIDAENSTDKRQLLEMDRFGYQSMHFIAAFSRERSELLEYKRFAGLRMEIQIRSILQHAWAEIEHDLGYKSASGIPREIRRRFARVAGLLELADAEFSGIRQALHVYADGLPRQIEQHPEQVELDLLSLQTAYAANPHLKSLDRAVAAVAQAKLTGHTSFVLERALPRLAFLGIKSVAALEQAARAQAARVEAFARAWMAGDTYGSLEVGISSTYLCYVLAGERQEREFVLDYLAASATFGVRQRERIADNILHICAKLPPLAT
ncbi:hypothetical protein V8J88_20225 [Massilia sp. W12]|uniref:GTP pyrophosphokinase n=1 Tax=Massilia sp. W12 TaxID=3126507 RepID=UPI0030D01AF0